MGGWVGGTLYLVGGVGLEVHGVHGEHGNKEEDQELEGGGDTVGDEGGL